MTKTFTFVWDDKKRGYCPEWVPNATIIDGRLAAHDVMEHLPNGVGGFEGEMMAMGAMRYVRRNMNDTQYVAYFGTYYDLKAFLLNVVNGSETLTDPGVYSTKRAPPFHKHVFLYKGAARTAVRGVRKMDTEGRLHIRASEWILGWMLRGYREAEEFYSGYGISPDQTYNMFLMVREVVNSALRVEREVGNHEPITVTVDYQRQKVWR